MKICEDCNAEITLRKTKGVTWRRQCLCGDFSDYEPKERATIIVPSRFPDIFGPCKESLDKFAPLENKILVRDGHDIPDAIGLNWKTIQAPEGFIYSRNINLGIKEANGDVFLCNDDVVFTHKHTLEILQNISNQHPEVGILSPLTNGKVGEYVQGHCTKTLEYTTCRLCFVAVLIPRKIIDEVGMLDEDIGADGGYGWDDVSMSRRVTDAGYKLGVTARASVQHCHVDGDWSTSFRRLGKSMEAMDKIAAAQFKAKHGHNDLGCYGPEGKK